MTLSTCLGKVLIVDDEIELMRALCESLTAEGFLAIGTTRAQEALEELARGEFDLLLTDLMMPGLDGIELLKNAHAIDPALIGIIMTGQGSIQSAVDAMKAGAFDYILKPFRLQKVRPVLDRALEVRRLKLENVRLRQVVERLTFESPRFQIVGETPAMKKVLQMIEKVAPTDATVLVRGESGTGKELVARAIHRNSPRRDKPLVTVNCAALQEQLLESELFGHEKGSFTGADRAKPGLFEIAEGGTLFIDEVAEMSPAMQAKFLRVLENGDFRRVGGTTDRHANVRVIAATNKPLEEEQKAGRFREDLYYRLNVVTISLPPLCERRADLPLLIDHLLTSRQIGARRFSVDPAAVEVLMNYHWPGNVRELANVLERAQILADGQQITVDDLPDTLTKAVPITPPTSSSPDALDAVERRHVAEVLAKYDGNKVRAAKALGISRRALYRLIERHGLSPKPPSNSSAP